ncbi:MAG: hypothetical protein ACI920_002048, partial [Saprospiraceae bacterium]
ELQSNTQGLLVPRREVGGADWTPAVNGEGMLRYDKNSNQLQSWSGNWKPVGEWGLNGAYLYYLGGNVGIGTTNPTYHTLTVEGTFKVHQPERDFEIPLGGAFNGTILNGVYNGLGNGAQLRFQGVPGGGFIDIGNDALGSFVVETNDVGRLFVNQNGNVGIGTNAPGEKLHVMGHTRLTDTDPTIALQDTDGRSGFIHMNSNLLHFLSGGINASTWAINGNKWPLTINMGNDAATFGGPAYFMEGNVGIGTTTPTFRLTIAGFEAIGLDNGGTLEAKNSAGNYEMFLHPRWTNDQTYLNYGSGGFNIRNNSSTVTMFMQDSGNVGIGTTSPLQRLHVFGNMRTEGNLNVFGDAAKPGGGMWSFVSDLRLKKDIENFDDGLEAIRKVRPISYHYNGKKGLPTEPRYVGIVAQELQEIAPYMVSVSRMEENVEEYLTVDPNAFLYMLINSVQELDETVQMQQKKIEAQRAELQAIKKTQQDELSAIKKALEKAGISLD